MSEGQSADYDALLLPHSIIGVEQGRQGAGQTIPSPLVLCGACGWQRVENYHDHLVAILTRGTSPEVTS